MRVIEPQNRPKKPVKRRQIGKVLALLLLFAIIGVLAYSKLLNKNETEKTTPNNTAQKSPPLETDNNSKKLKVFTGEQFRDLYNSFSYPNTAKISEKTPITGDLEADNAIRKIAVERGYVLRSAPVTNAFQEAAPGYQLQQRAAKPWQQMQAAANKDGINLGLSAAYRSAEDQRQIFMQRLQQLGLSADAIKTGHYDQQISQVLRTTAIPGYSRHHTGYTVDISCENQPASAFEFTTCFQWLSANNYEHAKEFGWMPSYPPGAGNQGPDPESWEYVWVGRSALTE